MSYMGRGMAGRTIRYQNQPQSVLRAFLSAPGPLSRHRDSGAIPGGSGYGVTEWAGNGEQVNFA